MREEINQDEKPRGHAEKPCDEILAHDAILLVGKIEGGPKAALER
jgi:hypothetical protein